MRNTYNILTPLVSIYKYKKYLTSALLSIIFSLQLIISMISNYSLVFLLIKTISALITMTIIVFHIRVNGIELRDNNQLKKTMIIATCMLIFFIYLVISLIWSENRTFGIFKIIYLIVNNIPLIACTFIITLEPINVSQFVETNLHKKFFTGIFLIIGLTAAVISIAITPFNQSAVYEFEISRWSHVVFGRYMGIPLLISFMLLLDSKYTSERIALSFLFLIFSISIYYSGFRAGMLGVVLVIGGYLIYLFIKNYISILINTKLTSLFSAKYKSSKSKIESINSLLGHVQIESVYKKNHTERSFQNAVYIFIAAILTLATIFWTDSDNTNKRFKSLAEFIQYSMTTDGGINSRIEAYETAWNRYLEYPIFGTGFGGFNSAYSLSDIGLEIKYPHNIILEFMTELGIPGLIFLVITIVFIFNELRKVKIHLILFFVYALILAMFSKDIATNSMLWMFIGFTLQQPALLKVTEG